MGKTVTTDARGIALVALSAVSYGFMPLFAKVAYAAGASTHTLLFLRFCAATAFMFILMRARGQRLPGAREAVCYLLIGSVIYAGQSLAYFLALDHAPAGVVALLLYTYPIIVVAASALVLRERIGRRQLIALALAVVGTFAVVGGELGGSPLGIVLALTSAAIYASYVLVSARVVRAGAGVRSSALIMAGATLTYGCMNLVFGFQPPQGASGWIAVALLALVSTVIAFWSFLTGLERTGPATAALVSTLEPVVVVVTSALFVAEPLTPAVVLGGLLVVAALVVTSLPDGRTS